MIRCTACKRKDELSRGGCVKQYLNKILCGNCLEVMRGMPDKCVDMILCDLPYGTTACSWDTIIPFEPLWEQYKRIAKDNAAIVLTASQPFTSKLIMSNLEMFKYCWVWNKPSAKGHFNAKKRPMMAHEDIVVFYAKQPSYTPQMTQGHTRKTATKNKSLNSEVYNNNTKTVVYNSTSRYPRSIQTFKQETQTCSLHPTQKPVSLFEYLIITYTKPGEIVLDNCIGSGTTAVAATQTNRQFIGIELSPSYVEIAMKRLAKIYYNDELF